MMSGLKQCKDAINNAVGPNSRGFDMNLVKNAILEMERKDKKRPNKADNDFLAKSRLQIRSERRIREVKRRKIDRVLLGEVATDASFFRKLIGYDSDIVPRAKTPEQVKISNYYSKNNA